MPWIGLIAVSFATTVLLAHRPQSDWRESLLRGALWWGVGVVLLTEGLSVGRWLQLTWLAHGHGLASLGGLWFLSHRPLAVADVFSAIGFVRRWSLVERLLLAALVALLAINLAVALLAAPNMHDSMTYQLSRVLHWQQNGSVAHYPTHILRQVTAS